MTDWFADTSYFIALLNAGDVSHARAVSLTGELSRRRLVTTTWVLTETADALAAPANRRLFRAILDRLRANPRASIVPASEELFAKGVELYEGRPDKAWSLTDCISFAVMTGGAMTEALTADHHFEQAGFIALLK